MRILLPEIVFVAGIALGGATLGAIDVFVLGNIDPKFEQAPMVAFEIYLYFTGFICVLGGALASLALRLRQRFARAAPPMISAAFLLGLAYIPLLHYLPDSARLTWAVLSVYGAVCGATAFFSGTSRRVVNGRRVYEVRATSADDRHEGKP